MKVGRTAIAHFSYFWGHRLPHELRLYLELRSGTLLQRQSQNPLTYVGLRYGFVPGLMQLRFEGCPDGKLLYSFGFDAAAGSDSRAEARCAADAERAFQYWLEGMALAGVPRESDLARDEAYESVVSKTLDFEAAESETLALQENDQLAIVAAQQFVLAKLRTGARYAISHHEGMTTLGMHEGVLMRRDSGEVSMVETYLTGSEILTFLRSYFDYDARKGSIPHKPPELKIWNYIGAQFK